jgi:hypothetical protein
MRWNQILLQVAAILLPVYYSTLMHASNNIMYIINK